MTYTENLEKLRQAGVIDMTLSFGTIVYIGKWDLGLGDSKYKDIVCKVSNSSGKNIYLCGKGDERHHNFVDSTGRKNSGIIEILGHPLTIGRVLRWIEKTITGTYWQEEPKKQLDNLRHNKDLPLDNQENRGKIAKFLVSLIK